MSPIESRIRQFLVDELLVDEELLTPDYPLFESSLLDSLSVYEIQGFLEDEFDIDVSEEDLVVEKIGSVRALARFAEARMHDGTGSR